MTFTSYKLSLSFETKEKKFMLKTITAGFFLSFSSLLLASEYCSALQEEIDFKLKSTEVSVALFNEDFKKVENSTLDCKDVQPLITRGHEIIATVKEIRENAIVLEENCGVSTPIKDHDTEVSLRIPYIHFYKIINCPKTDL